MAKETNPDSTDWLPWLLFGIFAAILLSGLYRGEKLKKKQNEAMMAKIANPQA